MHTPATYLKAPSRPAMVGRLALRLSLAVLLSGIALVPPCPAAAASTVEVVRDTAFDETTYRSTAGGCSVAWTVRAVEPQVVIQRRRCGASLAAQLPLMQAVGEAFFRQDPHAAVFRTLFWGRLAPDETRAGPQEMACRLALAAHRSADWDARQGRPLRGDLNGFVRQLANAAPIYPELADLFGRFNCQIEFASAEKVLVMRADKLPFYDRLKGAGVAAAERLPFDCLTWFSVRALH